MSDTHRELYFARYDARHRLITGGNLLMPFRKRERMRAYVSERMERLFPQIGPVTIDPIWNGYVGMTRDFFPRMHSSDRTVLPGQGAMAARWAFRSRSGRELARAVTGTPVEELALPLSEPEPLPAHALVRRLAPLTLGYYRYLDAKEI